MTTVRQYPPYIRYLIVTVMSVALLAIQATVPFKNKALGFLFIWTSFCC